eukprot:4011429-Prymnesium_polylepis.1
MQAARVCWTGVCEADKALIGTVSRCTVEWSSRDLTGREASKPCVFVRLVLQASLVLSLDVSLSYARAGMLSSDGRCKTFDSRANGYVRGEGIGSIVL